MQKEQKMKAAIGRKLCRNFAAGEGCKFGDDCWFLHPKPESDAAAPNPSKQTALVKQLTVEDLMARAKILEAKYAEKAEARMLEEERQRKMAQKLGNTPCKNFAAGCCLYGDECWYKHDSATVPEASKPAVKPDPASPISSSSGCDEFHIFESWKNRYKELPRSTYENAEVEEPKKMKAEMSQTNCRYFAKSKCAYGPKCWYKHDNREVLTAPSRSSTRKDLSDELVKHTEKTNLQDKW